MRHRLPFVSARSAAAGTCPARSRMRQEAEHRLGRGVDRLRLRRGFDVPR